MFTFPALPTDGEPTRSTLHAYAHAVEVLPRAHAPAHPLWWHISMKVRPDGLVTEAMPLPAGGAAFVRMDPRSALIVFETSSGESRPFPMNAGLTATEMGNALIAAGSEFGLFADYERSKFEDDDPRPYDERDAKAYFGALVAANGVLTIQRNRLEGVVGPIQLWPHGFDLAFEWFGTRTVPASEGGGSIDLPAQINLGFYPAGAAYFYSNPWPFEADVLLDVDLPGGAKWHTEGWKGSMMPYADLVGRVDGEDRVLTYAAAVFEAAAPGLMR
ncbi:MAG: DUF5996 family protein [Acidimicrobiia bacterium]